MGCPSPASSGTVSFILIADGPSDLGLVPVLERLCLKLGAERASGSPARFDGLVSPPPRDVESRLRRLVEEERAAPSLFFVHRDAERVTGDVRRMEVLTAALALNLKNVVPVIPVRMTEAWLMGDETAIRQVAGNPRGTMSLALARDPERDPDPKETLTAALMTASAKSGRRLKQLRKEAPSLRGRLLERLDECGTVNGLVAWRQLETDLRTALSALP